VYFSTQGACTPSSNLGQYATASEVSEAVRGLQYYSGGTATGLALRHLTLKSFGETADEKPKDRDVSRVAIVITDGRAQDNAEIWAERARLAGIRIFAVGVGKAVESELKAIANDPDEEHSFYGADFSTMQQIADKLKHRICIGIQHYLYSISLSSLINLI
uniref:VWFA domain-containing protein n=1 Tax=Eptatretus burgeri TaxID=7764 RepID=A0A8C4QML0_EPTBU